MKSPKIRNSRKLPDLQECHIPELGGQSFCDHSWSVAVHYVDWSPNSDFGKLWTDRRRTTRHDKSSSDLWPNELKWEAVICYLVGNLPETT